MADVTPMKRMSEAYRETGTKRAEAEKERKDAMRSKEAAQLKEQLRSRFLSVSGSDESQFEAVYPELLNDHIRSEMNRG